MLQNEINKAAYVLFKPVQHQLPAQLQVYPIV